MAGTSIELSGIDFDVGDELLVGLWLKHWVGEQEAYTEVPEGADLIAGGKKVGRAAIVCWACVNHGRRMMADLTLDQFGDVLAVELRFRPEVMA
jgi:hypothetical protein